MSATLAELLTDSARRAPGRTALEDPERSGALRFEELAREATRVREALARHGVGPGDRVGVAAPKSIATVAAVCGVLEAGAAYVPVDPLGPPARNAAIFDDCSVAAVLASPELARQIAAIGRTSADPLEELAFSPACGGALALVTGPGFHTGGPKVRPPRPNDTAYVLYTSGSTGRPKGVVHTHASALSFVDWCSDALGPTGEDRFSSHAPLHFDLSVFDLYVSLKHGATLVLLGEELGRNPLRLADAIAQLRISVWYSTPSILRLLVEFGRLERHAYDALRLVLFAGEVFPARQLRALQSDWPGPRYVNLYGPTETNVCTWYAIPGPVPADREDAYPIGRACSGDRTRVVHETGRDVAAGTEGELVVSGGSVMQGYWNLPEATAKSFVIDATGTAWYRTGDLVREDAAGDYVFLGRRDRMVKRRGNRVELGEIEAVLSRHPQVREAAVVAVPDESGGVRVDAFLCLGDGAPASPLAWKRWCSGALPAAMVPDRFAFLERLPKTSTDKVDYRSLQVQP